MKIGIKPSMNTPIELKEEDIKFWKSFEHLPCLAHISTKLLVGELRRREGVEVIVVNPYDEYSATGNGKEIKDVGPAILFVVTD